MEAGGRTEGDFAAPYLLQNASSWVQLVVRACMAAVAEMQAALWTCPVARGTIILGSATFRAVILVPCFEKNSSLCQIDEKAKGCQKPQRLGSFYLSGQGGQQGLTFVVLDSSLQNTFVCWILH